MLNSYHNKRKKFKIMIWKINNLSNKYCRKFDVSDFNISGSSPRKYANYCYGNEDKLYFHLEY